MLAKVGCEVVYQPPRPQSPTSPIFKTDASFVTEPRPHDTALHNQEGTSSPSAFFTLQFIWSSSQSVYLGLSAARYVRPHSGYPSVSNNKMTPPRPIIRLNRPLTCLVTGWPNLGNPPMPGPCTALQEDGAGQPASYEASIPPLEAVVRSVPSCTCMPWYAVGQPWYFVLVFAFPPTAGKSSSSFPAGWAMTSGDRGVARPCSANLRKWARP